MKHRELLRFCGECNRDYPASKWRLSPIYYQPGVSGWRCPRGHEVRWCDGHQHDKRSEDGLNWECSRCNAAGLMWPEPGSSSSTGGTR